MYKPEFLEVLLVKIIEVTENKKQYLNLLLLADEQENMIDHYLNKGNMYVLDDNGVKCECVVTNEGNDVLEIKNIATVPESQGKGYAKTLIDFIIEKYKGQFAKRGYLGILEFQNQLYLSILKY